MTVGSAGSKKRYLILYWACPTYSLEAFAATGWRVGWLIGPKWIMQPTLAATTRIVFCSNSPLQEAAAGGLEQVKERKFFETQCAEYIERRDILAAVFDELGLKYTLPEGGYFILLVGMHNMRFVPHSYLITLFTGCIRTEVPRGLSVPTECTRTGQGFQVSFLDHQSDIHSLIIIQGPVGSLHWNLASHPSP